MSWLPGFLAALPWALYWIVRAWLKGRRPMKLLSIAAEAAACREACRDAKVGDPMWLLHHGRLLEWLTEPVENRIAYILAGKPKREQARRLRELRRVRGALPAPVVKARAAYDKARAAVVKALAAHDKARAAYDKARAAYDKARAAVVKARAAYDKAGAAHDKARAAHATDIEALHRAECPDSTWNGHSIFG